MAAVRVNLGKLVPRKLKRAQVSVEDGADGPAVVHDSALPDKALASFKRREASLNARYGRRHATCIKMCWDGCGDIVHFDIDAAGKHVRIMIASRAKNGQAKQKTVLYVGSSNESLVSRAWRQTMRAIDEPWQALAVDYVWPELPGGGRVGKDGRRHGRPPGALRTHVRLRLRMK